MTIDINSIEKLKKYLVCFWVAAMIILVLIIGIKIVDADIILDQSWYMLILMISLCTTVIAILLEGPVQRYLKNRPPPVSFVRQFRLSRRQAPEQILTNREDTEVGTNARIPSEPPSYFSSLFEDQSSLIPLLRNMPNFNFQQTFSVPVFYESPPSYDECNFEKRNEQKTSDTFSVLSRL
ncbi:unnamed protein product [Oikopleura dioica]|uniref:Uncharacterized protein n=1 Tax=Oikopleura dioica TaxID=34765 RepID=E4XKP1_OIKDI|nr:unnamed protein product [Oikopleura dioica]